MSLLDGKTNNFEVIDYLINTPSIDEIQSVLVKLDMKPIDLVRKGENVFQENYKGKNLTDEEWIKAMVSNPILIERPIVVKDDMAIVGRPPERVNQLF